MRNLSIAFAALFSVASPALAGETVDYLRDIKPIFKARCYACHGALKQESGLRLDTAAAIRQGGDSGPAAISGNVEQSLLLQRVSARDESERMPPEGKPLEPEQIAKIAAWIKAGASAPADEQPEADPRQHWAFQPPRRPPVPAAADPAWSQNPVDAFLAAERERRGLKPVREAQKSLLARRVYLDLIGLPPTRRQLHAFLADERPEAYERLVDELLASPQYGERWGRHWMDVWRYSDWYGLGAQLRNSQKHIWHWRDWIVESLNADRGYDRMVMEMLAGDELAPTERDTLRATGYLARNYYLFNRTTWLDETIEHTSKAFLGLTINCAKCHDHKYDPISQLDYYRMRAVFEPHQVRLDALPGETDLERNGLPRVFDAHLDAATWLHKRGNEKDPDKSRPIEPGPPALLTRGEFASAPVALPLEASNPSLQAFVLEDQLREAERQIERKRAAFAKASGESIAAAEKALTAAEQRPNMLRAVHAADVAKSQGLTGDALAERIKAAALISRRYELALAGEQAALAEQKFAAAEEKAKPAAEKALTAARDALAKAEAALALPGDKYILVRASLKALEGPAEKPDSRDAPYPRTSSGRRTALARWIAARQNPLTARVAVNQIWMRHFGQPLVESVEDFGRRAPRPALQDLLDWLAVELMDQGWSMKRLHRLLVTSQAYRLSASIAGADEATVRSDPNNAYYWRRRPMRMESQVVRDSLLQLAGALDPAMGGPTIDPKQDAAVFRRSLYFTHSRDDRNQFLSMFDDADILHCYRRTESIVPQQALTMANSRLTLDMARRLAARLNEELGLVDDAAFVDAAFETVLCLPPDAEERSACLLALSNIKQLLDAQKHPRVELRAREDLVHALLNHNDFVTIR